MLCLSHTVYSCVCMREEEQPQPHVLARLFPHVVVMIGMSNNIWKADRAP